MAAATGHTMLSCHAHFQDNAECQLMQIQCMLEQLPMCLCLSPYVTKKPRHVTCATQLAFVSASMHHVSIARAIATKKIRVELKSAGNNEDYTHLLNTTDDTQCHIMDIQYGCVGQACHKVCRITLSSTS